MDKTIYELMEEHQDDRDKLYYFNILDRRGVEIPCEKCQGLGTKVYGDTSTWTHGIGGQMITTGICDECWGSGDKYRKGANLRYLYNKIKNLEHENKELKERIK